MLLTATYTGRVLKFVIFMVFLAVKVTGVKEGIFVTKKHLHLQDEGFLCENILHFFLKCAKHLK